MRVFPFFLLALCSATIEGCLSDDFPTAACGSGCMETGTPDSTLDSSGDVAFDSRIDAADSRADSTVETADAMDTFDAATDGDSIVVDPTPPRPIAPLSTSTVTSRRPTLHWLLPAGTDGAHVDLCHDRVCSSIVATIDATGTSGKPSADLPVGVVFWRLHGTAGGVKGSAASPTWQFTVGALTAPVDTSGGATMDVNGDGYADAVIGAPNYSSGTGRVYIFVGGSGGISASAATTIDSPDFKGNFGVSVASAGDVNGDGYGDVIVGANKVSTSGGSQAGRAYVFLGSSSGLPTTPSSTLDGSTANGQFGFSVAGVGDLNGDGYGDLLVGEPGAASGDGRATVFVGSASGTTTTGTPIASPSAGSGFGWSVAGAGDVNGDALGDAVVGAYNYGSGTGRAYVFAGGSSGLPSVPSTTIAAPASGGSFGASVAGAGDVNGDGYMDVAIGASQLSSASGAAYVFEGGTTGVATVPSVTLPAPASGQYFGNTVAGIGDVNSDGYSDVAVSAPNGNGTVFVYAGSSAGLPTSATRSLIGVDSNGGFGVGLASGDTNDDGFSDLLVGAPQVITGTSDMTGRAYCFVGSSAGLPSTATRTIGAPDPNGFFGYSLALLDVPPRFRERS